MNGTARTVIGLEAPASFDVVCAGEALWDLAEPGGARPALSFRPGGGAVSTAVTLARMGLHVGLASALADDSFGRALVARIAATGVDVGGVRFERQHESLVFVERNGASRQIVAFRDQDEHAAVVPAGWTSQVLLLSGLSPVVSHAAALCKAARQARRTGTVVVVDIHARRHLWAGRDSRAILMVLREADVVRCSADDLMVLWMDESTLRTAMRRDAVLVVSDSGGAARMTGSFGEIAPAPRVQAALRPETKGDAFIASICADLARLGHDGAERMEIWQRAIQRSQVGPGALSLTR